MENCYNLGEVIGNEGDSYGIGGIAGTEQAKIRNCFSKGNVTGESTIQVGGIIGNTIDLDDENGNNFWDRSKCDKMSNLDLSQKFQKNLLF